MSPELANPRAERVKAVRALTGRSARRRTGWFLAEGPQAVREAVRHAPGQVRDLYLTTTAADRYPEIVADASVSALRVHLATPEVLDAMSGDAQGVLAVLDTRADDLDVVVGQAPRLVAVLASVRDPGNAGTVIRVADAAGADAVVLAGSSVEAVSPKVVRASAGSLFHLPVLAGVEPEHAVSRLRAAGLQVLAADGAGDVDLFDLQDAAAGADLARPTAWLFGNEAWGLSAAERALADAVVRVPLLGRAESLNLAAATAICLYASARAHR